MDKLMDICIWKYYVHYELMDEIGHVRSMHIYAGNDNEFHAYMYKLMEFGIFHEIRKTGMSMEMIKGMVGFVKDGGSLYDCYFYWMNRKYYIFDEAMKGHLLRCFETLEHYEICHIIFNNY